MCANYISSVPTPTENKVNATIRSLNEGNTLVFISSSNKIEVILPDEIQLVEKKKNLRLIE